MTIFVLNKELHEELHARIKFRGENVHSMLDLCQWINFKYNFYAASVSPHLFRRMI